jgi:hypothetical protein
MILALAALAGNTRMQPADGIRARTGRTAAFGDCKGGPLVARGRCPLDAR